MSKKNHSQKLGSEKIRWDLKFLYKSLKDKQIKKDMSEIIALSEKFYTFKGKLNKKLEDAIKVLIKIDELSSKLFAYLGLLNACDASNEEVKKLESYLGENISSKTAALMTYFDIELGKLSKKDYDAQIKKSQLLKHHKSMMDRSRKLAKYNLSEEVETALSKRSPFGSGEWSDMLNELDTKIKFKLGKEELNQTEILHLISHSDNASKREKALNVLNERLKGEADGEDFSYAAFRARALNIVMGAKYVSDTDRGFKHPMEGRNLSNSIDDATVKALHDAVISFGAKEGKRYYKILAKILGKKKLLWSDRNASVPFKDNRKIDWNEALDIVLNSYGNFSPTLRQEIENTIKQKRIDAPVYKGKTSGAFNYSIVIPNDKPVSFTFMNYLGSTRDVMTLAHELGHGVHGLLAGKEQGTLMCHAPMAYAETASIFGEMLTFTYLLEKTKDKKQRLALLLMKSAEWLNTVNRQISFSLFEQKCHEQRKSGKLSVQDFNKNWMDVTYKLYGKNKDVFEYKDMDYLWSYVGHFMRPFYVYAYSFGELFTQSLFAVKDKFGDDFENMYLDLLKSGNTKSAIELMKPFGLDPTDKKFWINGIKCSITKWLNEAEKLIKELKV